MGHSTVTPNEFLKKYDFIIKDFQNVRASITLPCLLDNSFDRLCALGCAVFLLAQSKYHSQFNVRDYLLTEIVPALENDQLLSFFDVHKNPVGLVSWAEISTEVQDELHTNGRALHVHEWSSGTNVFVNDWISIENSFCPIFRYIRNRRFSYVKTASSLRRLQNTSVKKGKFMVWSRYTTVQCVIDWSEK